MTTTGVLDNLKRMVCELNPGLSTDAVTADIPLLEGGLDLDSVAVLSLISEIEQHYGLEFRESDLRPRSFASLSSLAEVVARYLPNLSGESQIAKINTDLS